MRIFLKAPFWRRSTPWSFSPSFWSSWRSCSGRRRRRILVRSAAGGEARKIRAGDRVVAERSGRALLVSTLGSSNMRLFRVPVDGPVETEVPADAAHALRYSRISQGSLSADGRLLASLHESWFGAPAVLDTRSGRVQPLPYDRTSDYVSMVWLPDGRMMALRVGERSTLWRFTPEREQAR